MLDQHAAAQIAADYLQQTLELPADDEVIITEATEAGDWWLFYYTSRVYANTGDLRYAIVEGHPVAVNKQDGRIEHG